MPNFMDKIAHKLSGKDSHDGYTSNEAQDDMRDGKQRMGQQQQRSHETHSTSSKANFDDSYGHQQGIRSSQQSRDQFSSSGPGTNQMRGGQHANSGYVNDQSLGGSGEYQTQNTISDGIQQPYSSNIRQTRSQTSAAAKDDGFGTQESQEMESNQYSRQGQAEIGLQQGHQRGMSETEKYINRNL